MGRQREYTTIPGRVTSEQADAIRRLARQHDRPHSWILRRLIDIGLAAFSLPTDTTDSNGMLHKADEPDA